MTLKIEYKKTQDITPYLNNSRIHDDAQVAQIAASIKEFGFTNPILIDEQNTIIAGHGRHQAAQTLDMEEVPVIKLEGLSEAQRKAYVIADNKIALNASWSIESLEVEFQRLKELNFDIGFTGFEAEEIAALLKNVDDSEFSYDFDEDESQTEPLKTDEGYAEFVVVLQKENKQKVLEMIQSIKLELNTQSTEDAFMALILK